MFTAHIFNAPNTFDAYFRTIVLDNVKNILAGSKRFVEGGSLA